MKGGPLPMYNKETLKRYVRSKGAEPVIEWLLSDQLPIQIKDDLKKDAIFSSSGCLNLSAVYALV